MLPNCQQIKKSSALFPNQSLFSNAYFILNARINIQDLKLVQPFALVHLLFFLFFFTRKTPRKGPVFLLVPKLTFPSLLLLLLAVSKDGSKKFRATIEPKVVPGGAGRVEPDGHKLQIASVSGSKRNLGMSLFSSSSCKRLKKRVLEAKSEDLEGSNFSAGSPAPGRRRTKVANCFRQGSVFFSGGLSWTHRGVKVFPGWEVFSVLPGKESESRKVFWPDWTLLQFGVGLAQTDGSSHVLGKVLFCFCWGNGI